jgi:hypothetical protein
MTDDTVDRLVRASARFSDAQVAGFDLGSSDIELMEEIIHLEDIDVDASTMTSVAAARHRSRRTMRRGVMAVAGVAAAAVGAITLAPGSHGSGHAIAWAATPDPVSEATIAAVDTACRAASPQPLPDASTIDLRGDAGAALYELSDVWQICIFLRDGDGVAQAELVPQPIPTGSPGLSEETVGPIYQISNVTIGGAAIFVVAGDCVGPCGSDMRIVTDAGQGSARISSSGTFVAWAPIGPSGLFGIEEGNGFGVVTTS